MKTLFHRQNAYLAHRLFIPDMSYFFPSKSHRNFIRSAHKKMSNPFYRRLPNLRPFINRILSGTSYEENDRNIKREIKEQLRSLDRIQSYFRPPYTVTFIV